MRNTDGDFYRAYVKRLLTIGDEIIKKRSSAQKRYRRKRQISLSLSAPFDEQEEDQEEENEDEDVEEDDEILNVDLSLDDDIMEFQNNISD